MAHYRSIRGRQIIFGSCRLNPGDVVGEGGALGIAPIRGATVRVRTGGAGGAGVMK